MSAAKHTPGPWYVVTTREIEPGRAPRIVHGVFRKEGHYAHIGDFEREEDANACSALPALLEIAQTIVAVCDSGNFEQAQLACTEDSPLVGAARAAIAKATGSAS